MGKCGIGNAVADLVVFDRRLENFQGLVLAKQAELDTAASYGEAIVMLEAVR